MISSHTKSKRKNSNISMQHSLRIQLPQAPCANNRKEWQDLHKHVAKKQRSQNTWILFINKLFINSVLKNSKKGLSMQWGQGRALISLSFGGFASQYGRLEPFACRDI